MSASRKIQLQAEDRAKVAIAEAMARAERMTEKADARARELIAEYQRRMEQLSRRSRDLAPRLKPSESVDGAGTGGGLEPEGIDPNVLHNAIAVHAYYKAEQRGFGPGHEVEDWLSAETEFLDAFSSLPPNPRLDGAGGASGNGSPPRSR